MFYVLSTKPECPAGSVSIYPYNYLGAGYCADDEGILSLYYKSGMGEDADCVYII